MPIAGLTEYNVNTLYIVPGAPWENGYYESFNSRFRDELLNGELFTSIKESKVVTEDHRLEYNHRRFAQQTGVSNHGRVRGPVSSGLHCATPGLCSARQTRRTVADSHSGGYINRGQDHCDKAGTNWGT